MSCEEETEAPWFVGRWKSEGDWNMSVFEVSVEKSSVVVSGIDQSSGELFVISNIVSSAEEVSFDTLMPSTGRRGRQTFRMYDGRPVSEFVFSDVSEVMLVEDTEASQVRGFLHGGSVGHCLNGTWRAEEDDWRSEYTIGGGVRNVSVSGRDYIDGEIYEIENVVSSDYYVQFEGYVPSTNRIGLFRIERKGEATLLSYTLTCFDWLERCDAR